MLLRDAADLIEAVSRTMRARGLRVAARLSLWERVLERCGYGERWECLNREGVWIKYWRRDGAVPDEALKERKELRCPQKRPLT